MVTGRRPRANDRTVTWTTGFSDGSSLLPIANVPPGRSIISGHVAHSRDGSWGRAVRAGTGGTMTAAIACRASRACASTGGSIGPGDAAAAVSGRRGSGGSGGAVAVAVGASGDGGSGGTFAVSAARSAGG